MRHAAAVLPGAAPRSLANLVLAARARSTGALRSPPTRAQKTKSNSPVLATRDNFPLLSELLAEQHRLDTPVVRFTAAHDAPAAVATAAVMARELIPLSAPRPGEQYAFEVDLDACTGCKSCVAACHSLNGLDEEETWRDVGLLVSSDRRHPFSQTVTTACHHCAEPACLNGCPVLAYEKDPVTGIVRHLDDQCIGCSYCILQCPYDVPKYSKRLGIVRKCDLCHGRLAHGEPPACAQACPTQAIRVVVVEASARPRTVGKRAPDHEAAGTLGRQNVRTAKRSTTIGTDPQAPGLGCDPAAAVAPAPLEVSLPGLASHTRPSTRYVSRRPLPPTAIAADHTTLRPQAAHWPLVFLLMLMPMAIGCGLADEILTLPSPALAATSWLAGIAGLAFSVAHLGQPRRAWRIFLGVRRSWLSREALVFGLWLPCATTYAAIRLHWLLPPAGVMRCVTVITGALGVLGLFCSVMIYADTRRAFWQIKHTAPRFFGSAIVLGLASALACTASAGGSIHERCAVALAGAIVAKLLLESHALEPLKGDRDHLTTELKTARLLAGPLRKVNEWRAAAAVVGGVIIPILLGTSSAPGWLAWPALAIVASGELLERSLFFRAVDAPKMPGVPR